MSNKRKKPVNIETAVTQYGQEPGFIRSMWQQTRLVYYLMRDREVPIYLKLLPFLSVAYFVMPVDFIPDFFLGPGQLDDLALVFVGTRIFLELVPAHIVERHMTAIRENDGYLADYSEQSTADDFTENGEGVDSEIIEGIIIDDGEQS